jgi:hypothetical protein
MSNIANAFAEKLTVRAWDCEPQLTGSVEAAFTIPASSVTFYDGQALGRDVNGTIVNIDDTVKAEFIGIQKFAITEPVSSTDTVGQKYAFAHRPYAYVALIASAAKGQEGQRVYWLYNNQVAYGGVTNWNVAGTVLAVVDSTHVLVLVPWLSRYFGGSHLGTEIGAATGTMTLTKFDANKDFLMPITGNVTINLAATSVYSPSDDITFIKTTSNADSIVFVPAGADSINASTTTYGSSTVQFHFTTLKTDGAGQWYTAG